MHIQWVSGLLSDICTPSTPADRKHPDHQLIGNPRARRNADCSDDNRHGGQLTPMDEATTPTVAGVTPVILLSTQD